MSIPLDCYSYIVGLSRTACSDCYTIPVDAGVSYSGLFIDELEALRSIQALLNCEEGTDVFVLMAQAREEAILKFIADANIGLQANYQLKRRPFYGSIGRVKKTTTRSLIAGYQAGVRWACADIVSGIAKITNIGTLFAQTGVITLTIYNNLGETISSHALNTTANLHTLNTVDIELPLHSNYIDNIEYFFVYTVGANLPKDNLVSPDCCHSKYCFNTLKPYYYDSQTNKQFGWANYAMVGGFYKADLSSITDCEDTTDSYMNGLTFQAEFKCKVNDVLCDESLDFVGNPLALSMAHAVNYKAGELLMNKIQMSPNLNRENMINNDAMNAARPVYIQNYDDIVKYVVEAVDVTSTDCLECREWLHVVKKGILS